MFDPFVKQTPEAAALRKKNLETIETYMRIRGLGRGEARLPLFTKDGVFQLECTAAGETERHVGTEGLRKKFLGGLEDTFPDWGFDAWEIHCTEDPNLFFVECDGSGMMHAPDWEAPRHYENHYIIPFDMEDGKIKRLREWFNPIKLSKLIRGGEA